MNFGQYIKNLIEERGYRIPWVADKVGIHEKTLHGKIRRDSFSYDEMIGLAVFFNIDLNQFKEYEEFEKYKNPFAGGNEND
jgi:hypothetical protein